MHSTILEYLNEECTPAYVLDMTVLQQRITDIKRYFKENANVEICYAMKANPFLVSKMQSLVDKFEVCSPGEFLICEKSDITMNKIVLSGVNKGYEDTLDAMVKGVEIFTVESWSQLRLIQQCAERAKRKVEVLIRLTSGNQFGVDKDTIRNMLKKKGEFPNLKICGLHYYSGTQKNVEKIDGEIEELLEFYKELKEEYQMDMTKLEYGPGLAIDYFGKKNNEKEIMQRCADVLKKVGDGISVTIELGRFLVADCGKYVTKVVDTKRNQEQNYCIVDGGINHLNYHGQVMGVRVPPVRCYRRENEAYTEVEISEKGNKEDELCICGSLCTIADVLVKKVAIKEIQVGDLFVFDKTGAYSVTEGIYLFLSRKLPRVYLLENGKLELLRDAYETYEWNCALKERYLDGEIK